MNFEVKPLPAPDEGEAIARALGRMLGERAGPASYRSRWFAAALREGTGLCEATEPGYAGRPRSTRGATRA